MSSNFAVIILVTNKLDFCCAVTYIGFVTHMITDQIGLHSRIDLHIIWLQDKIDAQSHLRILKKIKPAAPSKLCDSECSCSYSH